MTTEAERNRWLMAYMMRTGLLSEDYCQPGAGMTPARYWVVRGAILVHDEPHPMTNAPTPTAQLLRV